MAGPVEAERPDGVLVIGIHPEAGLGLDGGPHLGHHRPLVGGAQVDEHRRRRAGPVPGVDRRDDQDRPVLGHTTGETPGPDPVRDVGGAAAGREDHPVPVAEERGQCGGAGAARRAGVEDGALQDTVDIEGDPGARGIRPVPGAHEDLPQVVLDGVGGHPTGRFVVELAMPAAIPAVHEAVEEPSFGRDRPSGALLPDAPHLGPDGGLRQLGHVEDGVIGGQVAVAEGPFRGIDLDQGAVGIGEEAVEGDPSVDHRRLGHSQEPTHGVVQAPDAADRTEWTERVRQDLGGHLDHGLAPHEVGARVMVDSECRVPSQEVIDHRGRIGAAGTDGCDLRREPLVVEPGREAHGLGGPAREPAGDGLAVAAVEALAR